ncbi:MAG: TRAP transporter small permease [Deltaproteobacteria bacterium]|nr:TRAP transporter small permease [Deltaproteobacteria bacterium]
MSESTNPIVRAVNGLSTLAGYVSALCILAATLIIVEQVVVRYVFKVPTVWQVETSVYLLIAATFLGAPYGLKENAHINIDMIILHLSRRAREWLDLVTSVIALAFCLFLAWRGSAMWWDAYEGGWTSSGIFSFPLVYPYALLPLGMALTSLQYLLRLAERVKGLRGGEAGGRKQGPGRLAARRNGVRGVAPTRRAA